MPRLSDSDRYRFGQSLECPPISSSITDSGHLCLAWTWFWHVPSGQCSQPRISPIVTTGFCSLNRDDQPWHPRGVTIPEVGAPNATPIIDELFAFLLYALW